MSKIELTEQQTEKLRQVWLVEETHRKALLAVANELVAMGLVRPASDDLAALTQTVSDMMDTNDAIMETNRNLAARVAALEAKVNESDGGWKALHDRIESLQTPVPPPGWEAAKPRTEADRLGEVAYEADRIEGSGPWSSLSDKGRESWRKKALAVRKADRAAQLEPSEEEITNASSEFLLTKSAREVVSVEHVRIKAALIAAARVRLEKAEGGQ